MLDHFIKECHSRLLRKTSVLPLAYLMSRGITVDEMKKYQIGYTKQRFLNYDEKEYDDAELFNKWIGRGGYFIRERIVFPIYDEFGKVKGIETRALDERSMDVILPKYRSLLKNIKLMESNVRYRKFYLDYSKTNACLFGVPSSLSSIWEKKEVYLTEGIIDCLSLLKIYPNSISSMTANINTYQINWLRRYVDKVILLFDMDKKGQQAVSKIKRELEGKIRVFSISLKGKDVNEAYIKNGRLELKNYIDSKTACFY